MPIISFDRAVEYYDATRGFLPGVAEQIRDAILAYTGASADTRFMELGIGTGRIALPFVEAGYAYDGTDISIRMMAKFQQKLAEAAARQQKLPSAFRCRLSQADLTRTLPFATASYDVVIAVAVFHLIQNWQNVLRECRRILGPTGWMLISTHCPAKDLGPAAQGYDADSDVPARWNAILEELGVKRDTFRSATANRAVEDLTEFLQTLGAKTEIVSLLEHKRPALTARQLAAQLKARMFSADWSLPDAIHAQAVQRLERWLDTECANPDTPSQDHEVFWVLSASWGSSTMKKH